MKQPAGKQKPPRKKRLGWKSKTLIGTTVVFGATGAGLYYAGNKLAEMEAAIDQDNMQEICVTVGQPPIYQKDSLMNAFNTRLSDVFNALQNSPLGKNLYDIAEEHSLPVCYMNEISQAIHAHAFFNPNNPVHMGYSFNMISGSKHSAAQTTAHEFYHFYQLLNARDAFFLPANANFTDKLLALMVMEAGAKTVGTMVLHEMDLSEAETVRRFRLNSNERENLQWYGKFLQRYEDQPAEEARISAARDMMRHLLTGDVLYDSWRAGYMKRLYLNNYVADGENAPPDQEIFRHLQNSLSGPHRTQFGLQRLSALTKLPDGGNIMPENITLNDIIGAMQNTVKEVVEHHELWPERYQPTPAASSDIAPPAAQKAAEWRNRPRL